VNDADCRSDNTRNVCAISSRGAQEEAEQARLVRLTNPLLTGGD